LRSFAQSAFNGKTWQATRRKKILLGSPAAALLRSDGRYFVFQHLKISAVSRSTDHPRG